MTCLSYLLIINSSSNGFDILADVTILILQDKIVNSSILASLSRTSSQLIYVEFRYSLIGSDSSDKLSHLTLKLEPSLQFSRFFLRLLSQLLIAAMNFRSFLYFGRFLNSSSLYDFCYDLHIPGRMFIHR